MGRAERQAAVEELQVKRGGTTVLTYVTSTRQGAEAQMGMDAIAPIYKHLQRLTTTPEETRLDLFIHSNGGNGVVPWRIVTLLREYCSQLTVLVPYAAFSAATLTALGADKVLMHPMGMLGPTDPSITTPFNPIGANGQPLPVSVEDVASYIALVKDDVGIRHDDELVQTFLALAEKVHPLTLGSVKRTTSQSSMLGEKLLRRRESQDLADGNITEIVRRLTSELFFHGHPINAREARDDVGLTFVEDAPKDVADAMWHLYEHYRDDMRLDEEFLLVPEAIAKSPLAVPVFVPGAPSGVSQATVLLDPLRFAYVESSLLSHCLESQVEVTITRDAMGNYGSGGPQFLSTRWIETA